MIVSPADEVQVFWQICASSSPALAIARSVSAQRDKRSKNKKPASRLGADGL